MTPSAQNPNAGSETEEEGAIDIIFSLCQMQKEQNKPLYILFRDLTKPLLLLINSNKHPQVIIVESNQNNY